MTAQPRYALCELAFPDTTFAEDIKIALLSNATGLSVDEAKIAGMDPRAAAAELKDAGLQAAACIPAVMSFLPGPGINGPDDVEERVETMCEGVRRLAVLEPSSILCL